MLLPNEQQAIIHADRAQRLVSEGRFNDAIAELASSLGQDGRNAQAWLLLGELYAMAGHLEPAVSYLQKGVREDYSNIRAWTMLANAYCQVGGVYLELALEQLEQGLAVDDTHADLHYLKGNVLGQLGDKARAIECLQKALQLQPKHPYAQRDLSALGG